MRRYRSQRIQKTLIALSGAALASTMMFSSAQNINNSNGNAISPAYKYYQTKIESQLHKAVKENRGQKHEHKKMRIKKSQKD
jgi:hypothetical protein